MPPFFDGSSATHRRTRFSVVGPHIHAVKFSSTGKFVAIGNDQGIVEIKNTTDTWDRIRLYVTGSRIRGLCWHPHEDTVFVGAGNGNIYKISLRPDEAKDDVCCGQVPGFVHAMSLSKDGSTLAVVYGATIAFIRNPFRVDDEVGPITVLHTEPLIDPNDLTMIPIALSLHFIDEDSLVVTFTAMSGIRVYSLSTRRETQYMNTNSQFLGRSALSPSGRRLAVVNPRKGIDWFSFSHGRYMSTSGYSTDVNMSDGNRFNQLAFVDEDTVVVAHKSGSLLFVSFGMTMGPSHVADLGAIPFETLTSTHIHGHEHPIVVAIIPGRDNNTASSSAAIVVDVLLTDPYRIIGAQVEVDFNAEGDIAILQDMLEMFHPAIYALLNVFVSRFKGIVSLKVGASVLIAICAVWTTTSYYSQTIPQYPLVSHRQPVHTSTDTEFVTVMQTRLITTTATSIQSRACKCNSYTTTATSTLTVTSNNPRDAPLTSVPLSCVCTLSGSISVGTALPIPIVLQVEQDMDVEGNVGSM